MHDMPVNLSAAGVERRGEIFREMERALGRRVARRRAMRIGAGAAGVIALAAAVVAMRSGRVAPAAPMAPGPIVQREPAPVPGRPDAAPMRVALVMTDPRIVERWRVEPGATIVRRISDEELMAALAAEGRPGGIVRTRGFVLVEGVPEMGRLRVE